MLSADCAQSPAGASGSRARISPISAPWRTTTRASVTSRRTGSGAGSSWSSRSPRTSRCTTTAALRTRGSDGCSRAGSSSARRGSSRSSTCAEAEPRRRAGALSGGNQQKLVLAREIDRNPRVLIAAQPTRGLDVGAIEFVHRRLVEERDEGRGILLVSLELDEILSLSDRILVIYEGEIVGELRSDGIRGAARHPDDRRRPWPRGGRMSEDTRGPAAHDDPPEDPSGFGPHGRRVARRALRDRPEGGGDSRPDPHGGSRILRGWPRRARHDRQEPADDLQGDLRRLRASTGSSRGSRESSG